jgi:nanoRNase/pAp phosphatase (c-di-AMP/oligoRNAs hydrolase)
VREGAVLKPDEFEALSEEEQAERRENLEVLQHELEDTLREIPKWEKELREKIRALNREVTLYAVSFLIDEVKKRWEEHADLLEYLDAVHEDAVECPPSAPVRQI